MISFSKEDIFLVTGASSGIGRAAALQLNELGASVIITSRRLEKLKEVQNNSLYPENMFIEIRDLSVDIDNHAEWIIELSKKYGKLKGLVLSAGISFVKPLSLVDYSSLKTAQDILLNAQIMLVKGFSHRKVNNGGSVVIISSDAALYGVKGMLEYSSAKAALITAGKVMANELYSRGIRVNTISPGLILTPMVEESVKKGETNADAVQYAGKPEY
ncbi:MAG: SDR family oxidoreductase, partial [Mucispirillum sp.]|nr:SDR family oxidoreductase [Mucispirillum sp.]